MVVTVDGITMVYKQLQFPKTEFGIVVRVDGNIIDDNWIQRENAELEMKLTLEGSIVTLRSKFWQFSNALRSIESSLEGIVMDFKLQQE